MMSMDCQRGPGSHRYVPLALAAALLSLTGCGTTSRTVCESTAREVADDEVLPNGFTVADLADGLVATRKVPGTWADDESTTVSFSAVRAEGAAEWVASKPVTIEEPGGMPFKNLLSEAPVSCQSFARFPVDLSLSTEDGGLAIDERAMVTTINVPELGGAPYLSIDVEAEPDGIEGMPAYEDWFGSEETYEGGAFAPEKALVSVGVWGDTTSGHVGWAGDDVEDDEDSEGWSSTLLYFGDDE